jgi:hypothetical protein
MKLLCSCGMHLHCVRSGNMLNVQSGRLLMIHRHTGDCLHYMVSVACGCGRMHVERGSSGGTSCCVGRPLNMSGLSGPMSLAISKV